MRDFIYALMTDKENRAIFKPLKCLLYLVSLIYGLAIFSRGLLYRFGIFKTEKVPMKVISVGNLTLGGTGKTPFVIMLAGLIRNELKKEPSVLTRGYGWDEQTMLKTNLPDIPVIVGEDRVKSSRRAIRLYGSDTAILDDGFQYWELARDIDIVLVDLRNPFGNGRLFPRGILREPKKAIKRADVIVLTKANKSLYNTNDLKNGIRKINYNAIFVEAMHGPRYLYDVRVREERSLDFAKGKRAILLSGISDPEYFEETVKDLGAEIIEHIKFGDHYDYRKSGIDYIIKRCGKHSFDLLITTEKDAVKFTRLGLAISEYSLMVLTVEMVIVKGKEELLGRLSGLYSG